MSKHYANPLVAGNVQTANVFELLLSKTDVRASASQMLSHGTFAQMHAYARRCVVLPMLEVVCALPVKRADSVSLPAQRLLCRAFAAANASAAKLKEVALLIRSVAKREDTLAHSDITARADDICAATLEVADQFNEYKQFILELYNMTPTTHFMEPLAKWHALVGETGALAADTRATGTRLFNAANYLERAVFEYGVFVRDESLHVNGPTPDAERAVLGGSA